MRNFLFLFFALFLSSIVSAQNNDFSTAEPLNVGANASGKIHDGNFYKYYKTLLPADGTIQISVSAKHTSGPAGGFSMYVYDKSRRQIHRQSIGNSIKPGESLNEVFEIHSRAADSVYILVYNAGGRSFDYSFKYDVTNQSRNDQEPNGTRGEAISFLSTTTPVGHIGYIDDGVTDQYDYHKTLIPANGTVRIYLEGKHTGGSAGSFGFYVYDIAGRQISSKSAIGNTSAEYGETVRDTIDVFSRDADSLYMLVYTAGGRSYSYSIRYEVIKQGENDVEPNNTFNQPNPVLMNELKEGQIGYVISGVTDQYDYYKTLLPGDGTIRVAIEGTHTGGATGSFAFYAYDNSRRQIFGKSSLGTAVNLGGVVRDTIEIDSRGADSVYLMIYQVGGRSFNYKMSYEMVNQSINDGEPNGTFLLATPVIEKEMAIGHIGYVADGVTDQYDYYKTTLPVDGTIRFTVEGVHTGGDAGSFGFYVYDKSRRQIHGVSSIGTSVTKDGTVKSIIDVYSRAADSIYFTVYTAGGRSFKYQVKYEMIDTSTNDEFSNETFPEAIPLGEKQLAVGHIAYVADGVTDSYDYYKTLLPVDGTIRVIVEGTHTGGSSATFNFYLYDKSRRQILAAAVANQVARDETVRDTLYLRSRGVDSTYLLVYTAGAASFSYNFLYEMIDTSVNDMLPNETFESAINLYADVPVQGHIAYTADARVDSYDYYKTLLPVDGTVTIYVEGKHTGGSEGTFSFYAYDKQRRQIFTKSIGNTKAQTGEMVRDTLKLESRAKDSLYFLIYNPGGRSFSYQMKYDMPGSLKGDPEPNNTFSQALNFKTTDTLKGLIGYVQAGSTDQYDYYKAPVKPGTTLTVFLSGEHTGGVAGSFSVYAYDNNRRLLYSKTALGSGSYTTGQVMRDTVSVQCNSTDSVYIAIYQAGGKSFTYNVTFQAINTMPVAAFSYTRMGNDFGFINESRNSTKYLWKFGSNQSSELKHPSETLKPGFYNVQLIASDGLCNLRDTATKSFTVTGIEYFTPTTAGVGGDLHMQIFGGGLDTNAIVTLKRGSTTLPSIEKSGSSKGQSLGVMFDLHFAQPGDYDVEVKLPGGETLTYEKAFKVEGMLYPETTSEVVGPAVWRTGRDANFNLVVTNKGNTLARGVIVALIWPKSAQIEFIGKEYRPPVNGGIEVVMDDGEVIRSSNKNVQWIYDINTTTPIDTFATQPYDGYVRYFFAPVVPAGSTYEIPFKVKSSASGNHKFITYTVKPNMFGSCETYNINSALTSPQATELMINTLDWAVDELKVPPATKVPAQIAVKSLKVSQKHIDVSSQVAAHRFWAQWYGADDLTESEYLDYYKEGLAADEFAKKQIMDIAFDQAIDLGAGALISKRKNDLTDRIHATNEAMLNHKSKAQDLMQRPKKGTSKAKRQERIRASKEESRLWNEAYEKGNMTIEDLRSLEFLEDALAGAQRTKNLAGEIEALEAYIKEHCPEHAAALEKLKEMLNKEEDIINDKETDSETRTSFDPNAIYGPRGFKDQQYVSNSDRQNFVVMFENVDTAKADAQIVRILDTLDLTKLDLSTFEFGNISIGKKQFRIPKGRREFMIERSLAPDIDMNVRVNASLDTTTGIVFWQFTSIDTKTGDIPDFAGFLPPNKNHPSGEGSVSYSVKPRANLADGTQIKSRASIIFDTNDPILTNTWMNTIDAAKPTGNLRAQIIEDTLIVLQYSGNDAGSGVDYFNLYMSEDNGDWVPIVGGNGDSVLLIGEAGKTYRFYVQVQDNTGNKEQKLAVGEAVVKLGSTSTQPAAEGKLVVYPIPSNGTLNINFDVEVEQQVSVDIFSATGQRVLNLIESRRQGNVQLTKSVAALSNGFYFVRVRGSKGLSLHKKIIVVK